jgi:hypothetical protein
MVEWFKEHKFLIGIIFACLMLGSVAYSYQQKAAVDAKQNDQLTKLLEESTVNQQKAINGIVADVAERAYISCVTSNENHAIIKNALEHLAAVANAVPLRVDGEDPIDRAALEEAFSAVRDIQDDYCVLEEFEF